MIQNEQSIQKLFSRVFNGEKNFMTPHALRYAQAGQFYYELSQGDGIDGKPIYGVTVIEKDSHKKRYDLSDVFNSKASAILFIDSLKIKETMLSDRERVNRAINAQGTSRTMSVRVAVSSEFVDEMCGCVPPEFMGMRYPFQYMQVGEITNHANDGTPLYETYVIVTEEGKNSPLASAYEVNQWYFMGIKPTLTLN